MQLNEKTDTGKLKFNVDIKEVNEKLFQDFYEVIDKNSSVCNKNADQEILQAFLKVLGQGISIESKENLFSFNEKSQFSADFEASLNKGDYKNLELLMTVLPMQLTAQGRLETSKTFLNDLLSIGANQTNFQQSGYLDGLIENLIIQGMAQHHGDKLVSRFEYKFGEPRFSNY